MLCVMQSLAGSLSRDLVQEKFKFWSDRGNTTHLSANRIIHWVRKTVPQKKVYIYIYIYNINNKNYK